MQNSKTYLIVEITNIHDRESYLKYIKQVPEIIQKYGGRYVVRGEKITQMIGNRKPDRIIIIEFANKDQIEKCFNSPEYLKIAPFRENSTESNAIIVEGI